MVSAAGSLSLQLLLEGLLVLRSSIRKHQGREGGSPLSFFVLVGLFSNWKMNRGLWTKEEELLRAMDVGEAWCKGAKEVHGP